MWDTLTCTEKHERPSQSRTNAEAEGLSFSAQGDVSQLFLFIPNGRTGVSGISN